MLCRDGWCVCASRIAERLMRQFVGKAGKIAITASVIDEKNNNFFVTIREQGFDRFVREQYPKIEIVALMKIINGTYGADEGEMYYKGEKIGSHSAQDTPKMGIG